jgi:hypothetical protein
MTSRHFVIEIQGFRDNSGAFVLKEVAIKPVFGDRVTHHSVVRSEEPWKNLNADRRREANYNFSFTHGISWDDGNTDLKRSMQLMRIFTSGADHLWSKGFEKCQVLEKILRRTVYNLDSVNCPKSSELPYNNAFEECTLPVHKPISEGQGPPYKCAKVQAQQYAKWLKNNYYSTTSKQPRYCCGKKCFDKSLDTTEVDGMACNKCESYGRCYCRCISYMRDKLTYLQKQAVIVWEVLSTR